MTMTYCQLCSVAFSAALVAKADVVQDFRDTPLP